MFYSYSRSLPVDSDLETKLNKSLPVVKKSTTGRKPFRDEIQIFTTNSEKATTVVDQLVANMQEITTDSKKSTTGRQRPNEKIQ